MADVPEKTPDSLREDETAQTIKPPRVESGVRFGSPKVTEATAETHAASGGAERNQAGPVSGVLDATEEPDRATIEVLGVPPKAGEPPEPEQDTSGAATGGIEIGPLAEAEGEVVPIEQLLALKIEGGSNRFSDEVRDLLHQAREYPHLECDGVPVVDAAAYLRAVLLAGESRGVRSEHSLVKALRARDLTLDGVRRVRWPEKLEGQTSIPAEHRSGGLAGPDMTRILANAVRFAQRTLPHPASVFGRHAMAALIQSDEGRAAFANLHLVGDGAEAFFEAIHKAFLEHVKEVSLGEEDPALWDSILSDFPRDLPEWARPTEIRRLNPSYDTDATVSLDDDRLGMRRDAEALADLICLKAANPPLSIGLFGDWGAGKSTFMGMLEEAIDRATRDDAHKPDLFIKNVVHIRFNAWHYIDANLWASLVSHIFRELYDQTSDKPDGRNWLDETQLDALLLRLEGLRAAKIDKQERLSTINTNVDAARKRLNEINDRQLRIQTTLLEKYAQELIDSVSVEDPGGVIKDAARALNLGDDCPSARQLRENVREAFTLGGRIKLLVTSFGSPRLWPLASLMLGLVVFVGLVIALPWIVEKFELTGLRDVIADVGVLVAAVLGFVAWLGPHLQFINHKLRPLLDAYGRVVDKEKQAQAKRAAEAAVIEQELQELRAEQTEQERLVAEQESERADLEALAAGEQPSELLARFIEDRARGEGYRKHLGLVSFVRHDFEVMSDLMRELRRKREKGHAGINTKRAGDRTTGLPPIDRIILYIDDLDRCRHEQVVDVLEAIHLLLAFDLFVVVVGVDERWLRQSLVQAYPDQLKNNRNGCEQRASPADYLGKIFQIPIWLRPLSFGEQGNYSALLGGLIGDEVITPAEPPAPEPEEPENGGKDDGDESTQLTPVAITMPPHKQPSEETRDRVTITDKEFKLMTKLGPLIGRSPRAVKRFVNLYRLYRAGLSGEEREQLVSDGSPRYPLVLFWLAAETGLDVEQMTLLSANLSGMEQEALDWNDEKLTNGLTDRDRAVVSDALWAAVEFGAQATATDLRKVADEMSRYSFRPRVPIGGGSRVVGETL